MPPELNTELLPGATRVYTALQDFQLTKGNETYAVPTLSRLAVSARDKGFDIEVNRPDGSNFAFRRWDKSISIEPTTLEMWNCHCGKEACQHRHTLAAWSPRYFDRLRFALGAPRIASIGWDGRQVSISGMLPEVFSRSLATGESLYVAISGIVNRRPALNGVTLPRYGRIKLQNFDGTLSISLGTEAPVLSVSVNSFAAMDFGVDDHAERASLAVWNCQCGHHQDDPWIVPSNTDAAVGLSSYVASAIKGPKEPIADKSFVDGMYFSVATDVGFSLGGRVRSASIAKNSCADPECKGFEGQQCSRCTLLFDPTIHKRLKIEGRIILVDTFLEMYPPHFAQPIPPPYPSCQEFIRCGRCGNYYQITEATLSNLGLPFCQHVLGDSFLERLDRTNWNGDIAIAARVWDAMRVETNNCQYCPTTRPKISSPKWCPLKHCGPPDGSDLTPGKTILWLRRD
jgi:hypothetical protein